MPTFVIVLLIITAILVGVVIVLYFLGKKAEKKRDEQEEQIRASAQTTSMLIIDKKKMHLKDSGLPEQVIKASPWYAQRAKVPIVKAKVGPQIVTMIAANEIYDDIPVGKNVKATISGLYITAVRGIHGKIEHTDKKKKSFRQRLMKKYDEVRAEEKQTKAGKDAKQSKKKG